MGIGSGDGISVYEDGKKPEEKLKVPKEKITETESNVDDNGLEDWEEPVKEKEEDEEEEDEEDEEDEDEEESQSYYSGSSVTPVITMLIGLVMVFVVISTVSVVVSNVVALTGLGVWGSFDELLISVVFVTTIIAVMTMLFQTIGRGM